MAETFTVCHDCNQSTSGRCWRHASEWWSVDDDTGDLHIVDPWQACVDLRVEVEQRPSPRVQRMVADCLHKIARKTDQFGDFPNYELHVLAVEALDELTGFMQGIPDTGDTASDTERGF